MSTVLSHESCQNATDCGLAGGSLIPDNSKASSSSPPWPKYLQYEILENCAFKICRKQQNEFKSFLVWDIIQHR